ncbi:hypothetical protein K5I29_08520 [Flavobacterium agricola]|uniref:Uncharacterized protein n=1 Tax=Flavobacterium agricola TaxID=2870839 RepID=A0ABY6LX90_9FLAO|nr:hypothetical protein [Flavobacterium agricola]UYW00587.1 hypothetical protein K5I29_08520 [Flavobacterium agricola]
MKKFLFMAIATVAFLASCTADDVESQTKLNNVEEAVDGEKIVDKTKD